MSESIHRTNKHKQKDTHRENHIEPADQTERAQYARPVFARPIDGCGGVVSRCNTTQAEQLAAQAQGAFCRSFAVSGGGARTARRNAKRIAKSWQ